jgi:hypothetical protein
MYNCAALRALLTPGGLTILQQADTRFFELLHKPLVETPTVIWNEVCIYYLYYSTLCIHTSICIPSVCCMVHAVYTLRVLMQMCTHTGIMSLPVKHRAQAYTYTNLCVCLHMYTW